MLFQKKQRPEEIGEKTEQEPQFRRSVTGDEMVNYRVYYLSSMETIGYFILAFVVGGAVGYLFYGGIGKDEFGNPTLVTYVLNALIVGVTGLLSGKVFLPIRQQQILESRRNKLKSQFRDMLEALSTSLGAGKNVPDAFQAVYEDMKNQYEEGAFILRELDNINHGLINGFTIEMLIQDLGERSGVSDIEDFAGVFEICYRKGGNIQDTVRSTAGILGEKMGILEEIETTVTASKNEQYIMLIMPILLIGMIKMASADFAENFVTPTGLAATTIAIAMFVASYFLGKKLLDIKV